jgi:hypothetical protein
MGRFSGIVAPAGDGMVIEVHLDILDAPVAFLHSLTELGFEDDPFLDFHPNEYKYHYTGRTRAAKTEMSAVLGEVAAAVDRILRDAREANVDLYAESELVRQIHYFGDGIPPRGLSGLNDFVFETSLDPTPAKADVHVEFRRGTVPYELHDLLVEKHFYWVVTPASEQFASEEIATLQTSTYQDACQVFDRLVEFPLPASTGIHLEQKLGVVGTRPGLRMPKVTKIASRPGSLSRKESWELSEIACSGCL